MDSVTFRPAMREPALRVLRDTAQGPMPQSAIRPTPGSRRTLSKVFGRAIWQHPALQAGCVNHRCPAAVRRSRIRPLSDALATGRPDLLYAVAAGTAGVVGDAFLHSLARSLGEA